MIVIPYPGLLVSKGIATVVLNGVTMIRLSDDSGAIIRIAPNKPSIWRDSGAIKG